MFKVHNKQQYYMTNLPQIQAHDTLAQAVNARELHTFSQNCEKPKGGRPTTEYAITLDMAKELSMVERLALGDLS